MKHHHVFPVLCLAVASSFAALSFTQTPSMVRDGSGWKVEFTVSETTDVEVSIVKLRDSTIVCHLAAGMLGANPPEPFTANTLHQILTWDGKNDFGETMAQPESLSVRVRAGMTARLSALAGEDLYSFSTGVGGISVDDDGSVLILGRSGRGGAVSNAFLRKYDAAGNYIRTIYPLAAGLPAESVTTYGINVIPGGGWAPRTTNAIWGVTLTNSLLNDSRTQMLPIGGPGEIVLVRGQDMQIISNSGSMASATTRKIVTTPPAPSLPWPSGGPWGPLYFTPSHDPRYLYLSGWYYGMTEASGSGWLTQACDTGFWADGQVFKVDRATGVAASWLKLDSIPALSAERSAKLGSGSNATATIHGVAIDDSGHVFVCDRLHKRISVYDTSAVLLGSIPCVDPDYVVVSKRTGVVYVITRGSAGMNLAKYTGWRNPGPATAKVLLTTSIDGFSGAPCMVLTEEGSTTYIWTGYKRFGVRQYVDNGSSFSVNRDFSARNSPYVFDRVAVDRAADKVYWLTNSYPANANPLQVFSISDWNNPVAMCESTTVNKPLNIDDITVSPKGFIYGEGNSSYSMPVCRYTPDPRHAPLMYANTGNNISTCALYSEGANHRGMAVSWQGQIAVSYLPSGSGYAHDDNAISFFPDTGITDTNFTGTPIITHMSVKSSGIRFDPKGDLYVGTALTSALGWQVLPGFENDNAAKNMSGSVVKYAAGDTGSISGTTAVNAARVYPQPFGTYSGASTSGWCPCTNPRFDVDPYGRLYIPNAAMQKIAVADNAGNTILNIGQYGNTDSRGGLAGPGETAVEPAIPLGWANSVAASEDYIYAADLINARMVRVQMVYALDNIPGLTDHPTIVEYASALKHLSMISSPNPFNPSTTICISMPAAGNVRLAVYSADGRFVREIARNTFSPGVHSFVWAGDDVSGGKVSAGLYMVRLTVGKRVMTIKTVLAK